MSNHNITPQESQTLPLSAWRAVGSPPVRWISWDTARVGSKLVGKIISIGEDKFNAPNAVIACDGGRVGFAVPHVLAQLFADGGVKEDACVSIEYHGRRESKAGKSYHTFALHVADPQPQAPPPAGWRRFLVTNEGGDVVARAAVFGDCSLADNSIVFTTGTLKECQPWKQS